MRMPAAIVTMRGSPRCFATDCAASRICCGFTAKTTVSIFASSGPGLSTAWTPNSLMRFNRATASTSSTVMCAAFATPPETSPPMMARAMLPPPTKASLVSDTNLAPAKLVSDTKYRRPDAHHGGAFLRRLGKVVAHAHRQRVELDSLRANRFECLAQRRELATSLVLVRCLARHSHQAPQFQARHRGHLPREPERMVRLDSPLRLLAADVHLDADVQRSGAIGTRLRERGGRPGAIHAVHPVEALRYIAGLVGLQVANVVPRGLQIRQRREFGKGFLDVALAEIAAARGMRGANGIGRLRLGNGYPRDGAAIPL